MGDPESGLCLPAAAWTPPWEWNAVSVRALMKVRGDSARTLAKDAYVVDRAVEGWIYDGRSPGPGSAKELYRLWAQLDVWQREVFDALRANPSPVKGTESPSTENPRVIVAVLGLISAEQRALMCTSSLDALLAQLAANGDGTDRGQFFNVIGAGVAGVFMPLDTIERLVVAASRDARVDASLVAAHESFADGLACLYRASRCDWLAEPVARHANTVRELLRKPLSSSDRRRLEAIAVGSCAHAGLLAFQVGDRATAQRYFTWAGDVAEDAGDGTLRAQALGMSSILHSSVPTGGYGGDTGRAVELMRRAAAHARRADRDTRAWVFRWLTEELAAAGDKPGAAGSLALVERTGDQGGHLDGRGFFARYSVGVERELVVETRGIALVRIGPAEEALEALDVLMASGPRQRTIAVVETAAVRLRQEDPEETSAGLLRGVGLARDAGYAMGVERALGVRARFPEPWADLACVRELDERLRTAA
ncbi:MAG: hypothetical protein ACRDYA_02335 [Egibacteraceae bacterium]